MENRIDKTYYETGRVLVSLAFIYKAIEFFVSMKSLDVAVPSYFGIPAFWTITLAFIWFAAGISFLINIKSYLMSIIVTVAIVTILLTSTSRGFQGMNDISSTLLKFNSWFCMLGGALIIGSNSDHSSFAEHDSAMFTAGRILTGMFFLIAGNLHFANVNTDAQYILHGFPDAKFWVIFTGICWIMAAFSFWFNLASKLAATGVIILVATITYMTNIRGFNSSNAWADVTQIFSNLSLIGASLMLASRGYWWFRKK